MQLNVIEKLHQTLIKHHCVLLWHALLEIFRKLTVNEVVCNIDIKID